MINRSLAYRKSAKGVEAIANRQSGLAPKLRSVLIMVDGKKTGEDLYKVCAALGDAQAMLTELVSGAFIEPVAGGSVAAVSAAAAPSVAAPAAAVAPGPAAASGFGAVSQPGPSLVEAKRLAVRLLKEILGPLADDSCIAVESSKDIEQYTAAVKKAYALIRNVRGSEIAGRFGQEIEAHFPVI